MYIIFFPIILFIFFYLVSGVYSFFFIPEIENVFYSISPILCIFFSIFISIIFKKNKKEALNDFFDGSSRREIMTMCYIFLLAGAFSKITGSIGSINSLVSFALYWIPSKFLLVGVFVSSSLISLSIGSSMGTITAVAPIVIEIVKTGLLPLDIFVATVISGAMFGDNLSLVSDTTIASTGVLSITAKEKFKSNFPPAFISFLIMSLFLYSQDFSSLLETGCFSFSTNYSFVLLIPYILLFLLSICGLNIFFNLSVSIVTSFIIGYFTKGYSLIHLNYDFLCGIFTMKEIMVLSILVGGVSGIMKEDIIVLNEKLSKWKFFEKSKLYSYLFISFLVAFFDILFANNTIAILFAGKFVPPLVKKAKLKKDFVATILDVFSCVFKGVLPWGSQILLASSMAGISPLAIIGKIYYCYVLFFVTLGYVFYYSKK